MFWDIIGELFTQLCLWSVLLMEFFGTHSLKSFTHCVVEIPLTYRIITRFTIHVVLRYYTSGPGISFANVFTQ